MLPRKIDLSWQEIIKMLKDRRKGSLHLKQALRKFSETAKGWYWNMEKLHRKYAVKLYPMILVVNQFTCY